MIINYQSFFIQCNFKIVSCFICFMIFLAISSQLWRQYKNELGIMLHGHVYSTSLV